MANGYKSHQYAQSLSEIGNPIKLNTAGCWALQRSIPNTQYEDVVGLYPLLCCDDITKINDTLPKNAISFVGVLDAFGFYERDDLINSFDFFRPYKPHNIILPKKVKISKHHRYEVRKAFKSISIEVCNNPLGYFDDWCNLYAQLVKRHNINGIQNFSKKSFELQFNTPGIVLFRAIKDNKTAGLHIWYVDEKYAYSHLAVSSELGYTHSASYALYQYAIEYFRDKVEMLDIGAGITVDDGLSRFKRGWTDTTLLTYLVGSILDTKTYMELSRGKNGSYFPLYRNN